MGTRRGMVGVGMRLLAIVVAAGALGLATTTAEAASTKPKAKTAKHAETPLERETHRHNRRMAQLAREREAAGKAGDKVGVARAAKKVTAELKEHAKRTQQIAKSAQRKAKR